VAHYKKAELVKNTQYFTVIWHAKYSYCTAKADKCYFNAAA